MSRDRISGALSAGLAFVAFELFLTYGPPQSWLRMGFKANPKLRVDQIEECIRQAKSRLVGSLGLPLLSLHRAATSL